MTAHMVRSLVSAFALLTVPAFAGDHVKVATDCVGRVSVLVDGHGRPRDGNADFAFLFSMAAGLRASFVHDLTDATIQEEAGRLIVTTPDNAFCLDLSTFVHSDPAPSCPVTIVFQGGVELSRYELPGVQPIGVVDPCEFPGFLNPFASSCGSSPETALCDSGGKGAVSCNIGNCPATEGRPGTCGTTCGQGYFCCSGCFEQDEPCGPPGTVCKVELAKCRCFPAS